MKFSCCCGLITGFILTLLCAGGVYYYYYCKENPGAAAAGMQKVETSWEATKAAGDKVITTIKPHVTDGTVPAPELQTPEPIQLPPPPQH